jgi:hypothetical protein
MHIIIILISLIFGGDLSYEKVELSKFATEKLYSKIEPKIVSDEIFFEDGLIKIDSDRIEVRVNSFRKSIAPTLEIKIIKNKVPVKNLNFKYREFSDLISNKKQIDFWLEDFSDGLIDWMITQNPDKEINSCKIFYGNDIPIEFDFIKPENEAILSSLKTEISELENGINLLRIRVENFVYEDSLDSFSEMNYSIMINDISIRDAEKKLSNLKWSKDKFKTIRYYLIQK